MASDRIPIPLRENRGISDLARKAGVSISTASQKLKRGKTPEQIIEEAETWKLQQDKQNARHAMKSKDGATSEDDESYFEAQRRKEIATADLKELDLAIKNGELAPVAEINAHVAGMIIESRNILIRIAPELRDRLAIETDPAEIDKMVSVEIDRALYQLSEFKRR